MENQVSKPKTKKNKFANMTDNDWKEANTQSKIDRGISGVTYGDLFTLSEEDIKKILSTPVIEIPESNVPNDIHLSKEDRIKQAEKILKERSKLDDYYEPPNGVIAVPPPKDAPRYNFAEMFNHCDKIGKRPKELSKKERKQFEITKDEDYEFNKELIEQAMKPPTEESIELNKKAFDVLNKLKG